MRLIKMFGHAAVAAVAAMAFVGATSASAANTQLCLTHVALTCGAGEGSLSVRMNNTGQGAGTLLTDLVNVLCLSIEGWASPLLLNNPQPIHITLLFFLQCGTKAAHHNCLIPVIINPLANLNKTGLDTGTITATDGEVLVHCDNIDIFGLDIHCNYDFTDLTFSVGAQHLTANDTQIETNGGDLCPEESFLDGLLHTVEHDAAPADAGDMANRYILA